MSVFGVTRTLALLLAGAACGDSGLGPDGGGGSRVGLISRNLYVGADVDAVILALRTEDPADDLPALLEAVETFQRTDFPSRAAAIADEIAESQPHVIGLQEVSQIDLTMPLLGVDLHQDFLSTLLAELGERGLEYEVAAQVKNIESAPAPEVRLVDYDVLLVDGDRVDVLASTGQNFTANLGEVAPGVILIRGWVSATVAIEGVELTVASTHLESGGFPGLAELRAAQAQELVGSLDPARPAVLMGDLNDIPGSPMYQVMGDAGFVDVWTALQPDIAGPTCCHAHDLSNELPILVSRIDYIFARGLELPEVGLQGQVELLGEAPTDRIAGPVSDLWPSDHAGLAAELSLPISSSSQPVISRE